MTDEQSLLVIGIGNPDRGDDGVGPLVVQRLRGQVASDVALLERTGDALALIDDWSGRDAVILVDAAASGSAPGRIHRIDLRRDTLPPELSLSSTHALGVAEAVGLADAIGLLPAQVIAYAIEGGNFAPGAPVGPEVAASAAEVVTRVAAELHRLRNERESGPGVSRDGPTVSRDGPTVPRHGPARPGHRHQHAGESDGPIKSGHDVKRLGHDVNRLGHDVLVAKEGTTHA